VAITVRVVAVVVVVALGLYLVYLLRTPLGWLVLAGFIAVAVSGPVRFFERKMRRGFAIAIVYLGVILLPFLIAGVLVPPIVDQANNLATNAPQYARDLTSTVQQNKTLHDLDQKYDLTKKIEEQAAKLPGKVGAAAGVLASVGAGIISSIFAGLTILILSVFMVGAAPRWRESFVRLHPEARARALNRLFDRTGNAVGGYVRGALLQALIAGVTSWVVLEILGVPYPVALALIIALLDLDRVGRLVGGLPTDREHRDPAAHPVAGRAGGAFRGARGSAVRKRPVRCLRGPARNPGGGHAPDRDPRVLVLQADAARRGPGRGAASRPAAPRRGRARAGLISRPRARAR
jgi:predicted PurR-regulated permease PerM